MLDVLKSMSGGPWSWLTGWMFPSLIACSATAFFIVPRHPSLPLPNDGAQQTALLIGSALALALLLSAVSTFLYRVLEGYALMPGRLQIILIERMAAGREAMRTNVEETNARLGTDPQAGDELRLALLTEALSRYPASDRQVGPTRFGNAIRAFETYAIDHYDLDSQLFWSELTALAPDALRQEEASARASVDFLVCLIWLGPAYGLLGVASLIGAGWDLKVAISGIVGLALSPLLYQAAVRSCDRWANSVRAIVNLGRRPLAASLGFALPQRLADEREMWEHVGWFVGQDYAVAWRDDLDDYRRPEPPQP